MKIKIFGERNCGTNFLATLLDANLVDVEILHQGSIKNSVEKSKEFPKNIRQVVFNRLIDDIRRGEFDSNYFWKHAYCRVESLKRCSLYENTIFLFIVRNPFYFLSSLYRRPYSIIPKNWHSKLDFLNSSILANERDNLDNTYLNNPVELWNLKTFSYIESFKSLGSNKAFLIKYENLVNDPLLFLEEFSLNFSISIKDDILIDIKSTKNDPMSFYDYQKKSLNYDPTSDFSKKELRIISKNLDQSTCKYLEYEYDY